MSKIQIILSGVGGQGLVSAGKMLAEAAAIYEKKESLMGCAYGSEARGTFTKAEVIIDDTKIYFPEVQTPDYVIALHQVAYDRYVKSLGPDTVLIYDSDVITEEESSAKQMPFPISTISQQAGTTTGQNMVVLGILAALTGVVKEETLSVLVKEKFNSKPSVIEKNLRGISLGIQAGNNM